MKTRYNLGQNREIKGSSTQYQNNLSESYNFLKNQENEGKADIYQNKTFQTRYNTPIRNKLRTNSVKEQDFNNIYQNQHYDTFSETEFNLEKSISNERNINQSQYLPFYPISFENLYRSQTEKVIYCGFCGKPKRPRDYPRTRTPYQVRRTISREIIIEKSSKDDYVIKYNNSIELTSLFQPYL